ncbi:hypothetical protein E4T52_01873 [Aureobasidium sp. EXF-3400]|nr:hypothetical protein E4T51_05855 [Aureobasidium sp. EXF-12344]KAI4783267.1 hypothetical protein E4T52_01873 [Aureobasidium sp. EXF-3400]
MSETEGKQTYYGNCHCGAFKYSIALAPIKKASVCNCSICSRKGYLFARPEEPSDFKVEAGEGTLKTYTFGNGVAEHKFCPTCGSGILVEAPKLNFLVVNINTFKHGSVDIESLEISTTDRANIEPVYRPFVLSPDQTPEVPQGQKLYTGSCHCQAIKYTLVCEEIKEFRTCNCSFCFRNADMWIYPPIPSVNLLGTEEKLTDYLFGLKRAFHGFCGTCGVDVVNRVDLHHIFKAPVRPVNVRTINNIVLEDLKIEKVDGWSRNTAPYKPYEV